MLVGISAEQTWPVTANGSVGSVETTKDGDGKAAKLNWDRHIN